jgi:hypothetical protein
MDIIESGKATTATLAMDTRIIFERLLKAKAGDIISYDELSTLVGRDVKDKDRYVLQSALRKALSHNYVFGNIRKVGFKRLSDEEIVGTGANTISRTGRLSRRGIKKLASVRNFNELPQPAQVKHNAAMSILGMISHASRRKQVQAIERRAEYAQDKLSLINKI